MFVFNSLGTEMENNGVSGVGYNISDSRHIFIFTLGEDVLHTPIHVDSR